MDTIYIGYMVDYAPPQPKTDIEKRRWWNQICIDTLTHGIASGCDMIDKPYPCSLCKRCSTRDEMKYNPNNQFIGFTVQQRY